MVCLFNDKANQKRGTPILLGVPHSVVKFNHPKELNELLLHFQDQRSGLCSY